VNRPPLPTHIVERGVVAVARRPAPDDVRSIADALAAGGVEALELTLNDPEATALLAIQAAADHATRTGSRIVVGAGTVLSISAAERAIDAGATFLVSPHVDVELVRWAAERGVPMLPGAATPTEVLAAWQAGAAAVKVFPASVLGPTFVREMRGPFPDIPLQPTGGITTDNAGDFIRAGAVAVGIGSWLFAGGDVASIVERANQAVAAVASARAEVDRATA
jgi:2-dehydro-3-deoxyphosphogluconate aldolase/(4S)-4-hydroxy-2-oxoglutarate aldolase